jgi:MFS family permease
MESPTPNNPETPPPPVAYETPDLERPASSAPTQKELEDQRFSPRSGHDPYAALRFRDYRVFQGGWMLAVMGSHITTAAIQWEIFKRTGSNLSMAWVAAMQVIPAVFLALPAGAMADHFDRRRIVQISYLFVAACAIGLAAMSYRPGGIPLMYALLLLMSVAQSIGRPARAALLPQIVPKAVFPNAVAWNANTFQVATMVGPALAGWIMYHSLIRFHSVWIAYALNAVCSLGFCLMLFAMSPPRYVEAADPAAAKDSLLTQLLAGVRFVYSRPVILATLTLDLLAVLLGGVTYLMPYYATVVLHVDSVGFGWLRSAEAIGALSMGMLIAHLPPMRKAGKTMLLAVAGFGAAIIVFGISTNFWLSILMIFLMGACDNVSVVVRHSLVQILTPDPMRGRVSAVNNVFISASNELGGMESGLTAYWFGAFWSVVGGGIATILCVVAIAFYWPAVRRQGPLVESKSRV